jgi:hypothetical protein
MENNIKKECPHITLYKCFNDDNEPYYRCMICGETAQEPQTCSCGCGCLIIIVFVCWLLFK